MVTETTSMPAAPPTMPSNLSVVAVYDDMKGVEEALRRLAEAHFPMSHVSFVGQDQAARQPSKQRDAERALQRFHLLAHGPRRHAELVGGAGEAEVARRRLE